MNPNRQHEPRPSSSWENKAAAKRVGEDGDDDDDPEEEGSSSGELGFEEGDVKKMKAVVSRGSTRRGSAAAAAAAAGGGGGGVSPLQCQAEKCAADLTVAKRYHRRHKVCEVHFKAPIVIVGGLRQRFCQQCSRFHELSEFDEAKRSCRRRLAGHNERRRKSSSEGSSSREVGQQLKHNQCRESDERGRVQIILPKSPTFKHFHIH